jgi:ribosomal protein S18 acetylase RimI-like enzyme
MKPVKILDYKSEHQPYFESLNRAWLEKYFEIEPLDKFVLTQPEDAIIKPGGAIFMAEYEGVISGTVALRKYDDATYELTKMAVDENYRRKGIAEELARAAIRKAKELKADTVFLYSQTILQPAVSLYEKLGFKHIPIENGIYKRADIKMTLDLNNINFDSMNFYFPEKTSQKIENKHVRIVKADDSFAEAISSIGKKSFPYAFGHLFNDKKELSDYLEMTFNPAKIIRSLAKENDVFFVALINDAPAGFAKVKKFSLNDQIESVSQMEFQKLYVLPEYHGIGAGSALIDEVLKLANEIYPDYIWLNTHIKNEKAIRFYEKRGFNKTTKYYFTIGTQTFEYYLMSQLIAVPVTCAC